MGLAAAINAGFRIGAGPGAAINANVQRRLAQEQTEFLSTRKKLAEKEIQQRDQQIELVNQFLGDARAQAGEELGRGDVQAAVRKIEQVGQVARALDIPDAPELTFRQRLAGRIDGPTIGEVSPFGPFNAQALFAGGLPVADPLEAISGRAAEGPSEEDVLRRVAESLRAEVGSPLPFAFDPDRTNIAQGARQDAASAQGQRILEALAAGGIGSLGRDDRIRFESLFREANDALIGIGASQPAAPSAGLLEALNATLPTAPNLDGFTAETDFEALLDERDVLGASIGQLTVERARQFANSRVDLR